MSWLHSPRLSEILTQTLGLLWTEGISERSLCPEDGTWNTSNPTPKDAKGLRAPPSCSLVGGSLHMVSYGNLLLFMQIGFSYPHMQTNTKCSHFSSACLCQPASSVLINKPGASVLRDLHPSSVCIQGPEQPGPTLWQQLSTCQLPVNKSCWMPHSN